MNHIPLFDIRLKLDGGAALSKNEDYLDDLLNSVSKRNDKRDIEDLLSSIKEKETQADKEQNKKKREKRSFGDDFFKEFEEELLEGEEDDFIRDFELELDAEAAEAELGTDVPIEEHQDFISNIDGIMSEAKKKVTDTEDAVDPVENDTDMQQSLYDELTGGETSEIAADTKDAEQETLLPEDEEEQIQTEELEELDSPDEKFEAEEVPLDEETIDTSEEVPGDDDEEQLLPEDDESPSGTDDILNMLDGLPDDPELAEIGSLLKADEEHEEVEVPHDEQSEFEKLGSIEELADIAEGKNKKGKKDKKEKKEKGNSNKKPGFFSKLLKTLFGEDEDEINDAAAVIPEEGMVDNISDENLDILRELDDAAAQAIPEKKEKKEKKKKEKKAKPPKEKKPKKPKAPKPPKPPKEKDNTPPLPKKPVILIFVMALSILLLIMLGTSLIGKSNSVSQAEQLYNDADYVGAYEHMAGMKLKGDDLELYNHVAVLAMVQEEYDAYLALMDAGEQQMALDSLIRGVGRYDKYYEQAQEYAITMELDAIEAQIEQMLLDQFGVSADQARELYGMRDRDDYSIGIRQILENLGLE